jgi:hypothetical protein
MRVKKLGCMVVPVGNRLMGAGANSGNKPKQKTKKRTKAAFRKQAAEARKKSREIHNFSS